AGPISPLRGQQPRVAPRGRPEAATQGRANAPNCGMLAAHVVFGAAWDGSPLAGAGDGPRSRHCPPGNQSYASGQREAFFMRRWMLRRFWSVMQS
ncbi:MAG: hypothetical protein ACRD1T_08725, partial [Acidimicrobiia bacterium]